MRIILFVAKTTTCERRTKKYLNHAGGTKSSSCGEWGPALVIAEVDGPWEIVGVQLKDSLVAMLGCDHQDVVVIGILKLQETKKER